MRTKRRHEGYLLIDHRCGEGLVSADGAPVGAVQVPAGGVFETATITCSHCCRVVVLNPDRSRERAYCGKCDHYICDACGIAQAAAGGACITFDQFADEVAEKAVRHSAPRPFHPLFG